MRARFHTARRLLLSALVAAACFAAIARAAIVDLDAYVLQPIIGGDGVTPLADGSWVFIIGSTDNVIDPMQTYGGTNYIANSTTGDDVILGVVFIDSSLGAGTFYTTVQYESTNINYVYIRYFDTTGALTGMLYWGTSSIFELGVTLGVSTVQFDENGQLFATNYNHFVIIPEPSTANLLLLVGGMIWAMRASMGRKKKTEEVTEGSKS